LVIKLLGYLGKTAQCKNKGQNIENSAFHKLSIV
jgi:hypothetical protein